MIPRKSPLILSLILSSLILSACQQTASDLAPNYPDQKPLDATGESFEINIQKDVDILFVIDDSGSMKVHQDNLSKNINRFAEAFGKAAIADFQLGVLSIWDPVRYGSYNMESGQIERPGVVSYLSRSGQPLFDMPGRLRQVKAPHGQENLLKFQPKNFIRKHEGFEKVLRETLKIGVKEFESQSTAKREAQGPEYEDLFTPVLAALSPHVRTKENVGFYRPNAHLAIVMVTDANDSSHFSAEEMFDQLVSTKGGDASKVSVHAVVIRPGESSSSCKPDPSGAPKKVLKLAQLSKGKILSLCENNYARQLAELGQEIRDRTVGVIEYPLTSLPQMESIKVTYNEGKEMIPPGQTEGWSYDDERQVILIRKPARWLTNSDSKIKVTYIPVDPELETSKCMAGCTQR